MKRLFSMGLVAMILTITLAIFPTGSAFAQIADGTYNVPYSIKEAGNNNVSIADGYFSKPAKLIVKNGQKQVQMTITEAGYVKSLSNTSVVSESGNTRVVQMNVNDLSQAVTLSMHIVVPEEIAGMPYDNHHTARVVFDASGLPKAGVASSTTEEKSKEESSTATGEPVDNPPTGDSTSLALYVTLILSSIVVFSVYRLRFARD